MLLNWTELLPIADMYNISSIIYQTQEKKQDVLLNNKCIYFKDKNKKAFIHSYLNSNTDSDKQKDHKRIISL